MVNPDELLELLRAADLAEPLSPEATGQCETAVLEEVAKTLCGQLQKLAEDLPEATDREPLLLVMIARLFMDNLAYQAKSLEAPPAAEAVSPIILV